MSDERAVAAYTPGWYPDPIGRYELRFHNGRDWTADVSAGGHRYVDPLGVTPPHHTDVDRSRNGLATASMVLGIVAVSIAWLPFVVVSGVVLAIIALVFGVVGHRRATRAGASTSRAVTGLVLGGVALVVSMLGMVLTVIVLDVYRTYTNPAPHEVSITGCDLVGSRLMVTGEITNLGSSDADFTVHVEASGSGRRSRTMLVSVDDVAPGSTEAFGTQAQVPFDEVTCSVPAVYGPLPFGINLD